MKGIFIDFLGKAIWLSGLILVVGGAGLLVLSVLGLIVSFFSEEIAPVGALIATGTMGIAGIPLGRWLKKKRHNLSEKLWMMGESSKYSGVRLMMKVESISKAEKAKSEKRQPLLDGVAARSTGPEIKVVAQGGSGWEALSGKSLVLSMSPDCLHLTDMKDINEYAITFDSITDVSIDGPGTVTKGGGVVGGGFGVEGFLVGAAAASLVNLLTTHTTTKTLIRIATKGKEIFLLVSSLDPAGMRRYLSPVYTQLSMAELNITKAPTTTSVTDELMRLNELRRTGTINDDEFVLLKRRILQ